jgi:hypothetical protein
MKRLLLTLMFVSFLNSNSQNPIQEFKFDGSLKSADNTISFLGAGNFVNDRMGTVKSAQRLTNKGLEVVLGDLPQGNKPRSISIWVKFNTVTAPNYILGYGGAANAQYFGLLQQAASAGNSDLSLAGWGAANDVIVSVPLAKEVWYQYSVTYDGNVSKIYRNGELLKSTEGISRLTKGYILRLGEMNTTVGINADIDDVKVYTVAMTDEQIMESYNSSKPTAATQTASASNTVQKSTAAPAKTVVTAKTTAPAIVAPTNEVSVSKTVEVFSQGRKLTGSNASNIGDLPEGTYLLKITNNPAKK